MDDYLIGVLSNIGVISFVALSAYLLLLTGEISFGQQAFFAIGAYAAGIATALWGWPLSAALACGRRKRRRRGGAGRHSDAAAARPLFLDRDPRFRRNGADPVRAVSAIRSQIDGELVGPNGAEGFRGIRYIFQNNIRPLQFLG